MKPARESFGDRPAARGRCPGPQVCRTRDLVTVGSGTPRRYLSQDGAARDPGARAPVARALPRRAEDAQAEAVTRQFLWFGEQRVTGRKDRRSSAVGNGIAFDHDVHFGSGSRGRNRIPRTHRPMTAGEGRGIGVESAFRRRGRVVAPTDHHVVAATGLDTCSAPQHDDARRSRSGAAEYRSCVYVNRRHVSPKSQLTDRS